MQFTNQELFVTIVASIVLYILLCVGIIRFLFMYQDRKFRHAQQLVEMEKKYREETLRSQLEVQEQTRIYIGRELHDNIGTLSSLIKMNLNLAGTAESEEKKTEWIEESKEIVKKLITEVKQLSRELNTDRIADMSFPDMLQQDIQRIQKLNLFTIDFSFEGETWPIPPDKKIILYRICQELLHNIIKHAKPATVTVSLVYQTEKLNLVIIDDGTGFDAAHVSAGKTDGPGSGLINLQNRAGMIGGNLFINSSPGNGTKCYIEVPITKT
jgi:signal transduction histidine kinase